MTLIISRINPILIRLRYALLAGILFLGTLALFQVLLPLFSIELAIGNDISRTIVPFFFAATISLLLFVNKRTDTKDR